MRRMRSADADREEECEEGGEVKAEEVGTAESTLGASSQAKREEECGEEKATATIATITGGEDVRGDKQHRC